MALTSIAKLIKWVERGLTINYTYLVPYHFLERWHVRIDGVFSLLDPEVVHLVVMKRNCNNFEDSQGSAVPWADLKSERLAATKVLSNAWDCMNRIARGRSGSVRLGVDGEASDTMAMAMAMAMVMVMAMHCTATAAYEQAEAGEAGQDNASHGLRGLELVPRAAQRTTK